MSDLPEGVSLLGEDVEVLVSELDGRQGLQLQVGPALDELDQRLKGVEAQAVVAVVGQVGHEDTDLGGEGSNAAASPAGTEPRPPPGNLALLGTYRVEEHGEEELSSSDALVQLLGASWILVVEYGVCEEATGLSGQHLKHKIPASIPPAAGSPAFRSLPTMMPLWMKPLR